MSASKQNRGVNFTKEEEFLLLEEIRKEKKIVECKTTNKVSGVEKEQAWQRIANALAEQSRKLKSTGGGPAVPAINPTLEAVLTIINVKTVLGIPSEIDCDKSSEDVPIAGVSSLAAGSFQEEQEPPIVVDENIENDSNVVQEEHEDQILEENSTNWTKYVPRKHKKPVSQKLRMKQKNPVATAKEKYYTTKMLLLEEEREELKIKRIREAEEHEKKMELLDLKIKKKIEINQFILNE